MGIYERDYMRERKTPPHKAKLLEEATVAELMQEIASRSLACACIAVGLDSDGDGRVEDNWSSAVSGSSMLCEQMVTALARNVATHIKEQEK